MRLIQKFTALAGLAIGTFAAGRASADLTMAEGANNIIVQTVAAGAQNEPMLQIKISNAPGQPAAEVTAVRITAGAAGTGDDLADLIGNGVTLYRDVNNDGRVTLGGATPDTLLGSGNFSADGGFVDITGFSPVAVATNSTVNLVVGYSLGAGAATGESFQATIAANSHITARDAATQAAINVTGAPVNGFVRTVGQGKVIMQRVVQMPDGATAIPNRALLPVLSFTMTAQDIEDINVTEITFQDIGTGNAAILAKANTVRVFKATAAPTDAGQALGMGTFTADDGRATVTFGSTLVLTRNTSTQLWLTIDVAADTPAQIGNSLQFQIPQTNPMAATGKYSLQQVPIEGLALSGPVWEYNYNPIVLAKARDPIGAFMPGLANNYAAFSFSLQSDIVAKSEAVNVTRLIFHAQGDLDEGAAISQARLYVDAGTLARYDAADTLLGVGTWSGDNGELDIDFTATPVLIGAGMTGNFLLVYDLNGTAVDGQVHTVGFNSGDDIFSEGLVSLVAGRPSPIPFTNNQRTIGQPRATLTIDATQKNYPSLIAPGAPDFPIMGFTLKADIDENLNFAGLNLDLNGPLNESTFFTTFELWTDAGTVGVQDSTDVMLGVATPVIDNGGEGKLLLTIPDDQQPLIQKTQSLKLALYADVNPSTIGDGSETFSLVGVNNDAVILLGEISRAQAKFTSAVPPFSLTRTLRNPAITVTRYPTTPSPYSICINGAYGMAGVTFSAPSSEDLIIERMEFTVSGTLNDPVFIANGIAWKDTNKNFRYDLGDGFPRYWPAPVKVDDGQGVVDMTEDPIGVERTTANFPISIGVDLFSSDPVVTLEQIGKTLTMFTPPSVAVISGRGARSGRPIEVTYPAGTGEGLNFTVDVGTLTVRQDAIERTAAVPGGRYQEVYAIQMQTSILEGVQVGLTLQSLGTLDESRYIKEDFGISVYIDGNRNGKIGDVQDYLCFQVNRPSVDNGPIVMNSSTARYTISCDDVVYSGYNPPYDQYLVTVDLTEDAPEGETLQFSLASTNDLVAKGACSLAPFSVGAQIIYPEGGAPPLVGPIVTVDRGRVELTSVSTFINAADNNPTVVMAPGAVKYEVARISMKATKAENQNLRGLTLKATGTADDVAALADNGVLLYKGSFTATTTPLATGKFNVDDGTVTLTTFTQPIVLNNTTATELRIALTGSGTAQPGQTMNLSIDNNGVDAVGTASGLPVTEILPVSPWVNVPITFGPGRLIVRAEEADTKILPLTVTGGANIQKLKLTASRTEQVLLKDITVRARGTANELLALESGAVSMYRSGSPAATIGSAPFSANDGEANLRALDILLNASQVLTNHSLNSQLNLAGTIVGTTLRYDIESPDKILALGVTSGLPVQIVLEDFAGGDSILDADAITGRNVTLTTGIVTISAGAKNPANATITGSEQNLPLFQVKLVVDNTLEAVQISEARFCPTGTANALQVFSGLRVYNDVDNTGTVTGSDVQLASSQVIDVSGTPTIRFQNLNLPTLTKGSTTNLLIVGDLNAGVMQPGENFRIGLCEAPTLTGLGQLTQQPINVQISGQSPNGGTFSIPATTPTPTGGPSLTPTPQPPSNGSILLGHTFPTSLDANASAGVQITFRNSGGSTWTPEAGYQLKISNDTCSLFGGATALPIAPGASVAPNSDYVFSGQLTAATSSLSCALTLRMEQVGTGLFGQSLSRNVSINFIAPQITRDLVGQAANPGQNLLLAIRASGTEPLTYQWFKGTQPIDGATSRDLPLNGVTTANSGIYRCQVSNSAGSVSSQSVTINVFGAAQANNAQAAGTTLPASSLLDNTIQATVTMRNNSNVSWSPTQGYNLRVLSDPAGMMQGVTTIPITDEINVVPAVNGLFAFPVTVKTPATSGTYSVTFQMAEGSALFGDPFTRNIGVGDVLVVDLTTDTAGWTSGQIGDGGTATAGSSGLCMDAPLLGNNVILWVGPERMLPLVDMRALRVRVTASTTQTQPNAVPLWDIVYDNFNSSGFGNTFGGEAIFLDQAGEANGVGRPGGRTQFEIWAMPVAARTLQWRGMLPNGQDNSNGAFVPFLDQYNDIRLVLRVLDLDNAGVLAEQDSGAICISQINVQGFNLDAMGGSVVWGPPLNNATHAPQTNNQAAEGAGFAVIDDASASAAYQLTASGAGSRKILLPFDSSLFDPNNPLAYAPLFPVTWQSNTLYRGTLMIESGVEGGGEGTDPVDTIFVNFDAATNELVNIHVTLVGSPPDNFYRASSPRLASSTFGQPQPYSSFFYGHNSTLVDLQFVPNANQFRMLGDFYNVPNINPTAPGGDRFVVRQMLVEQMTVPAP